MQFSLLQICCDCDHFGTQMDFKLVHVGSSETRKLEKVGFRKHSKKHITKKVRMSVHLWFKKRVPKSYLLVVFNVPIPAWSPGWPRRGSQTQKHFKMNLQTWIFCYLRTLLSPSLETLWKYFVCSMNNKLIVLDVNLLFFLFRLGGKPMGGTFSMIPPPWDLLNGSLLMISRFPP